MTAWRSAMIALVLVGLIAPGAANAQRPETPEASEASVKAAFLYKFAGYVEWPGNAFASDDAPFVIAVLGADDVAAELARIVPGRTVGGHPVTVKKVRDGDAVRGAHLLFVGRVEGARLRETLRSAQQQGVFAVSESERGLELGAAINFVLSGERIGFEVSLDSAEKTGHRISSRMLAVARRVIPKGS